MKFLLNGCATGTGRGRRLPRIVPCLLFAICIHSAAPITAAETNQPPVRDLGGGVFEIGQVRLNRQSRTITFPGIVNMRTGIVEYVVVTSSGKVHESILRSDTKPLHIHTAMLLLGAKTGSESDPAVFFDARKPVPGESIHIYATWKDQVRKPLESLVFNAAARQPMAVTNWVYNGSRSSQGVFLAQQDGSIVSLIADPGALVNNPREDRENDELWIVNTNTVPAVNTEVQITFELPPAR